MTPIHAKRIRRALPFLAALALLPLAGDAANDIQCCTLASSYATSLFGGGNGDEDFFAVPAGSPNLMLLLTNASSMLDFPQPLPFPGSANSTESWSTSNDNSTALDPIACRALSLPDGCTYSADTYYTNTQTNTPMAAKDTPPYDNGLASTSTRPVNDAPRWGLPPPNGHGTCTPGNGTCLFNPAGYYFYQTTSSTDFSGLLGPGGLGYKDGIWTTDGARELIDAASACTTWGAPKGGNCQGALTTKGYYLFKGTGANMALFAGWFLNLYPPKFIQARKVVKSLATVDSDTPGPVDNVRIGLTIMKAQTSGSGSPTNSLTSTDGGILVVPLGPNCSAYPMLPEYMTEPRQAVIDAVNDPAQVFFWDTASGKSGEIPNQLAETLYNIGQYFSNYPGTGDPYTTLFGSSWVNTDSNWLETSAGTIRAPWATQSGQLQASFCWACQQSSVAIVTDGLPKYDNNLPQGGNISAHPDLKYSSANGTGDFRHWNDPTLTCLSPGGCGNDLGNNAPNLLHKVAAFLHRTDLRTESGMGGAQTLNVYVVSFGVATGSTAETLLQKTADLGGGRFVKAASPDELAQALNDAAVDVSSHTTSFSVSNTTALQTSQNTQLFLARFRPSESPSWEGHLSRYRVFNEFAEGCDPTKPTDKQQKTVCTTATGEVELNPNLNGREIGGLAACTDVFILDADCDPVVEGPDGSFMKGTFDTNNQLVPTTTRAKSYWDAGRVLSTPGTDEWRSADEAASNRRLIYTVLDTDGDGKLTSADARVELSTTITQWAKLKAALNVDVSYCTTLFGKMRVLGTSSKFDLTNNTAAALDECAKQVVWFIRGWDVLDEDLDGCGGPDFPSNTSACASGLKGEERDRVNDSRPAERRTFWKLGDIFHSSPAVVNPPATTFICDLALDSQCVATIHGDSDNNALKLSGTTQTPMKRYLMSDGKTVDAYTHYQGDQAQRQKLVLVGANDGMLHAFDAGTANPDITDAYGTHPYNVGTGTELWAFVPPDLLPKLKNALLDHEYFVDGNTMVRDIWADGSGSQAGRDGTKQSDEFHTIAVMSERSGGSEYVALDVTTPDDPKFLWMFPQPCSIDVSMMAQSWTGFAPRPPPIGPVKLAVTKGGSQDSLGRGFEERWVVMVNGGYDPSLTRGRGIWMMDAWTGEKIWRFTNDEFQNTVASQSAGSGMWPVPGSAALLDIGMTADNPKFVSDGFFDTATWGDIGGQIYVARFEDPDKTNWAAARTFEEQRQTKDVQTIQNRSEFYVMTSNTVDPATGFLHTYVGSGNRDRMLAQGASCGPDNVFGCFQAGCNTDVTTEYDYGSCSYQVKAHANNGTIKQDMSSTACPSDSDITCNQVGVSFRVETVCNGWKPTGGSFHASLTCDSSGNCSSTEKIQSGNNAPVSKLGIYEIHNRFYGIWSYGGPGRTFADLDGAKTFDSNRFTDITYTGTCKGPTGNNCQLANVTYATVDSLGNVKCIKGSPCFAGAYDPGWFYEYGHHDACPYAAGCGSTDWTDEKTGSGAGVLASCVMWNTFRPAAGANASTPCQLTSGMARNYSYLADYIAGVPTKTCGFSSYGGDVINRGTMRPGVAPPVDPTPMVIVGKDGSVIYSMAQFEPGTPPQAQQVGTGSDANQTIYWLEVPRSLHACRHANADQCE